MPTLNVSSRVVASDIIFHDEHCSCNSKGFFLGCFTGRYACMQLICEEEKKEAPQRLIKNTEDPQLKYENKNLSPIFENVFLWGNISKC